MNETSAPSAGQTGPTPPPGDAGPRVSGEQMRDLNRLHRSTTDRYVAGVAGGLGRHFDIDPTVIRVLLVVLTLFGGAGLVLYGAAWLLVPEDGAERAPLDFRPDVRRAVLIAAAAIAGLIFLGHTFSNHAWGFGFPVPVIVLAVVAIIALSTRDRRRERSVPPVPWGETSDSSRPAAPAPAASASPQEGTTMSVTDAPGQPAGPGPYAQQPPAWMPPTAPPYVPPPRPRRTGLVLFWPTLALIAISLGTLGIYDVDHHVAVAAYAALALGVTAVMLLIGAFVGRPGGLIALGLVVSAAVGITSIVDAATDGDVSARDVTVTPLTAAEVQPTYDYSTGSLEVDLSRVTDPRNLAGKLTAVRLNAGDIHLVLPRGIDVEVIARLRYAGSISIDGDTREGLQPRLTRVVTQSPTPGSDPFHLVIDARVGDITVDRG